MLGVGWWVQIVVSGGNREKKDWDVSTQFFDIFRQNQMGYSWTSPSLKRILIFTDLPISWAIPKSFLVDSWDQRPKVPCGSLRLPRARAVAWISAEAASHGPNKRGPTSSTGKQTQPVATIKRKRIKKVRKLWRFCPHAVSDVRKQQNLWPWTLSNAQRRLKMEKKRQMFSIVAWNKEWKNKCYSTTSAKGSCG